MDLELDGKRALVSGSTGGIGLAIATGLAKEGAHVVVNGRTEDRVKQALEKIKSETGSKTVEGVAADLSTDAGAKKLFAAVPEVEILVNNLGIFEAKPFPEITDDDWRKFFEVNVLSGIRLSRQYLPAMLQKNWGRIVFISSESGLNIPPEMVHYGMTKTAQLAVSRGLAEMTTGTGVTVNTVLPGPTMSEGVGDFVKQLAEQKNKTTEEFEKEFFTTMRPTSLLQRFADTSEVANLVTYVCSTRSSATNGAALRVDGGLVRSIN